MTWFARVQQLCAQNELSYFLLFKDVESDAQAWLSCTTKTPSSKVNAAASGNETLVRLEYLHLLRDLST